MTGLAISIIQVSHWRLPSCARICPPAAHSRRATTEYGLNDRDWVSVDVIYLLDLSDGLRLSAGFANVFDRDPSPARTQFGYDAQLANPLGRMFEVGLKKKF